MNPRLQAYLLQYIDHDEMTVDQSERSDKAVIDNLRRQLKNTIADRNKYEALMQKEVNAHAQTKQDLRDVGERLNMADATINSLRDLLQAVTAERDRYRAALETINTGMTGDWTPAGIAGQALEGGE